MTYTKIKKITHFFMVIIGLNATFLPILSMEEQPEADQLENPLSESLKNLTMSEYSASQYEWDAWIVKQAKQVQRINNILTELPADIHLKKPTLLRLALLYGKFDTIEQLVLNNAIVGVPELSIAAQRGDVRILRLLLNNGAKQEYYDHALRKAALGGHQNCAEELLRRGAYVNKPDSLGFTALHYAVASGNPTLIETLIEEYAADVNAVTHYNCTPLDIAHQRKGKKGSDASSIRAIVTILQEHGAKSRNNDSGLISKLSQKEKRASEDLTVMYQWNQWILNNIGVGDVNSPITQTPFKIEFEKPTLLLLAVLYADVETVRELIDKGAVIDVHVLSAAGERGCTRILRLLLERDAKRAYYEHALRRAVAHGKLDCIKVLLDEGAQINQKDSKGMTPLHHAVASGNPATVELILATRPEINLVNNCNWTALDLAIQLDEQKSSDGSRAIVNLLTGNGGKRGNKPRCLVM